MNGNSGSVQNSTFIDGMYSDLRRSVYETKNLESFIVVEEYDTDALLLDIKNDPTGKQSNVSVHLSNNSFSDLIKKYVRYTKLQKRSFSIGFIFYYWDYYKNENLPPCETQYFQNQNSHSGYHPYELFVPEKYSSIKEEILNNKKHNLDSYEYKISVNKVNKFIHTQKVKTMKSNGSIYLHYDISDETDISFANLLSVVLYCDWSELCTAFSATFRRNEPHEQLSSVKSRNREFAIWAKTLRETVQFFGQMGYDYQYADHVNEFNNRFKGPFFCGLSSFMIIPEFQIRLCGPTSTTKQIAVATKFGGNHGMIIQLNNNGHYQAKFLRSFCCCWLSNYNGEDEYLFSGGHYSLKMESIRNISTKNNFQIFLGPLFYFDCMINGTNMLHNDPNITNQHFFILNNLIKHSLHADGFVNNYVKYVNDMFESFTQSKTQIVINLHYINQWFGLLSDFIIRKYWKCERCTYAENDTNTSVCMLCKSSPSCGTHQLLTIKELIFTLFRNVDKMIIYSTDSHNTKEYPIDLNSLLSTLYSSRAKRNDFKIVIKATHKYKYKGRNVETGSKEFLYSDASWIHKLWMSKSESIFMQFISKELTIFLKETTDGSIHQLKEDSLIIQNIK